MADTQEYPSSDPPTQEKLYELTHNMTEVIVDISQHSRDCDCPWCSGEAYEEE